MGGIGSGRQGGRPTVDEGLPLDINRLLRDGQILPGRWVQGALRWTVVGTDREVASLGYEADLVDPSAAWMRLRYAVGEGEARRAFDYRVALTATRPPRGGLRWWFLCPASGRRCAKLHRPPGGDLFASRQAWRLGYASQRLAPLERAMRTAQDRAARIRRRLGGTGDGFSWYADVPPRPQGMWRRTYGRLRREALKAEKAAQQFFWAGAAAIVDRAERTRSR